MEVDSFKYTSRLVSRYYRMTQIGQDLPIPWTPMAKALNQSKFGLVTSGGLYNPEVDQPFDLDRESREPTWGDPSFRTIPADINPTVIGVSHHHINGSKVRKDMNILLPIQRFQEFVEDGDIGGLAGQAYSFMGYQGYPADQSGWKEHYGPQVADRLIAEEVDCVLLTTA
jgi:D-proline reductase (dithiol) PrdB